MNDIPSLSQFESLFRGSARLGVLLGALDLPWEKVTPFVESFPDEMGRYQELSVDDGTADLGLMTRGEGKDFTHRVARYMERNGIDEERIRRLLVTARYFEHRNLFFKIEVGNDGPHEFSWYFRRRPALDVARAWLAEAGVDAPSLDRAEQIARELGKDTVHFLACAERPDRESLYKLYFSQPEEASAFARLAAAAQTAGIDAARWAPLAAHEQDFAGRTTFLSLGFAGGRLLDGVKIDVARPSMDAVARVLTAAGRDGRAHARMDLLLQTLRQDDPDYAGFRLSPQRPVATRIYAYSPSGISSPR
jgi:hypothetical protein